MLLWAGVPKGCPARPPQQGPVPVVLVHRVLLLMQGTSLLLPWLSPCDCSFPERPPWWTLRAVALTQRCCWGGLRSCLGVSCHGPSTDHCSGAHKGTAFLQPASLITLWPAARLWGRSSLGSLPGTRAGPSTPTAFPH